MIGRDLIQAAFREGNLIQIGREPTSAEIAEALPRLQNVLDSLYGELAGETPRDWPVPPRTTADFTPAYNPSPFQPTVTEGRTNAGIGTPNTYPSLPPSNSRLVVDIQEPTTVYLAPAPNDGALLTLADIGSSAPLVINANGRLIDGQRSITLDPVSAFTETVWFYNAGRATWMQLTDIGLDDSSPFPREYDDMLIVGLYIRLAARFGKEPSGASLSVYMKAVQKFKRRYRQDQPIMPPDRHPAPSEQESGGVYMPSGF